MMLWAALLVRDEKDICLEVYDRGVLANVAALVKSVTPIDSPSDWDLDESESRVILREVCACPLPPFPSFISTLLIHRAGSPHGNSLHCALRQSHQTGSS